LFRPFVRKVGWKHLTALDHNSCIKDIDKEFTLKSYLKEKYIIEKQKNITRAVK